MKILDKIKAFFVKEEVKYERPTHPADTFLLLKQQIKEQFDLDANIEIYVHAEHRDDCSEEKRNEDWKMVNFVEEMAELWGLKIETGTTPAIKSSLDYNNGVVTFPNYSADNYFEYKSKEEE